MIQIALEVFTGTNLLVDLTSNLSVAFRLLFDQSKDIKLFEVLCLLKFFNDLITLIKSICVATRTHQKNSRFNK